jgi:hypothetical protein
VQLLQQIGGALLVGGQQVSTLGIGDAAVLLHIGDDPLLGTQ